MYCNAIAQSHHPENEASRVRTAPEPDAIVSLKLDAYRMLNDPNAPLPLDIRTLAQDFILKLGSKSVARHRYSVALDDLLERWCTRQGSNLRPSDPKSDALSN